MNTVAHGNIQWLSQTYNPLVNMLPLLTLHSVVIARPAHSNLLVYLHHLHPELCARGFKCVWAVEMPPDSSSLLLLLPSHYPISLCAQNVVMLWYMYSSNQ